MRSSVARLSLFILASSALFLAPQVRGAPGSVTITQFSTSTNGVGHTNPTWCPDGSQIAYDDHDADPANPSLAYKLYPVGSAYPMADATRENVDYKPDLTQLVYAKLDGTYWEHLYVRPIGGGTENALTTGTAGPMVSGYGYGDVQPCFSQDGMWVVFASTRGDLVYGTHSIWVVKTDGTGLKEIGGTMDATWPTWEPGGNAVLYTDAGQLYRVARTGSTTWGTPAHLADNVNHVRFSHDGKFLAFDFNQDIFVMNYATLARANLTNDGPDPADSSPTWGATDDVIAFSSSNRAGNPNTAIYVASGVLSLLATPTEQVTLGAVKAKYR